MGMPTSPQVFSVYNFRHHPRPKRGVRNRGAIYPRLSSPQRKVTGNRQAATATRTGQKRSLFKNESPRDPFFRSPLSIPPYPLTFAPPARKGSRGREDKDSTVLSSRRFPHSYFEQSFHLPSLFFSLTPLTVFVNIT